MVLVLATALQVGLLALQNSAYDKVTLPAGRFWRRKPRNDRLHAPATLKNNLFPAGQVNVLLTQVEVDAADPASATDQVHRARCTAKPGENASAEKGWCLKPTAATCRRGAPSPQPKRIVERRHHGADPARPIW